MSLSKSGALIGLVAATALAGCGKMGPLERPAPILGEAPPPAAEGETVRTGQDPNRPVSTVDPRDRTSDPAPPRTVPIEGAQPDFNRTAPSGAIPDPYARPR